MDLSEISPICLASHRISNFTTENFILSPLLWNCVSLKSLPIRQEGLVADPGPREGPGGPAPPPFLRPNRKIFSGDCTPLT